jgi:hypothetical protein
VRDFGEQLLHYRPVQCVITPMRTPDDHMQTSKRPAEVKKQRSRALAEALDLSLSYPLFDDGG